jgi:hypothetical protein
LSAHRAIHFPKASHACSMLAFPTFCVEP